MNNKHRIHNVDILRGLLMIIMAIDHCYLFFYQTHYSETWNSLIPNYGSIAIFFTRWVSNICAPGFALLMGMSITFSLSKNSNDFDKWPKAYFFIKRGIVLIILQQLLDFPSLLFNIDSLDKWPPFRGGVLYALGVSLIFSSFFIKVKPIVQVYIGTAIFFINYFIANTGLTQASSNTFLKLLFVPGSNNWVSVNYPAFPWVGITMIGLGVRKINFLKAGLVFLLIFIVLRFINFGDYNHKNLSGIINYLAVIKYPPSITFVILNMGILSLLFWMISKFEESNIFRPLIVFGQSSLFFYFAHIYTFILMSKFVPHSFPLINMYLLWLIGLLILFPICKYYLKLKSQGSKTSIWRYF
jgi:uncharacterized membrane protein